MKKTRREFLKILGSSAIGGYALMANVGGAETPGEAGQSS